MKTTVVRRGKKGTRVLLFNPTTGVRQTTDFDKAPTAAANAKEANDWIMERMKELSK